MMGYALAHWVGIRRDGVGSPWHEQNWIGSLRYAGVQGTHDKAVPRGAALDVPGRYFPPRRLVEFPLLYPYLLAPQKTPPEWVASQALRNSWPRFSLVYPKAKPSRNSSPPKSAPATAAAQLSSNWKKRHKRPLSSI